MSLPLNTGHDKLRTVLVTGAGGYDRYPWLAHLVPVGEAEGRCKRGPRIMVFRNFLFASELPRSLLSSAFGTFYFRPIPLFARSPELSRLVLIWCQVIPCGILYHVIANMPRPFRRAQRKVVDERDVLQYVPPLGVLLYDYLLLVLISCYRCSHQCLLSNVR